VTLDLIIIGLAIALDPLPLTAYILVLASKGGVRKGATFLLGWLASLAVVVAVTIAATGNQPPAPSTAPSIASLVVKIALGVILLLIALRHRRRMSQPRKPKKPPKWQASIDTMSPWYSMGLAPLLQPWGLIAAGAATLVDAKVSSAGSYLLLIFYCLLATSTYLVLIVYVGFWPERGSALLSSIREWMDTHLDQIIIIGCLVVGFWLIGKSAYLLITA
jgi:hypothetical protein